MINGFEQYTHDLTDDEKKDARIVHRIIQSRWLFQPISNKEIRAIMKQEYSIIVSDARIRKMIAWMHFHGYLQGLIASSKGYHKAQSIQELQEYHQSLNDRAGAIKARAFAVQRDINAATKAHAESTQHTIFGSTGS